MTQGVTARLRGRGKPVQTRGAALMPYGGYPMKEHLPLPRTASLVLLSGAMAGCLVLLALIAWPFVAALVWAMTLAVMFAPLDRRLRARTGSPAMAAALTLLLAGVVVVIPVVLVSVTLMDEIIRGAGTYGNVLSEPGLAALRQGNPRLGLLLDRLDQWVELPQLLHEATVQLGRWSAQVVQGSAAGLINLLLTFYFLFYLLRDRDKALAALARNLPLSRSEFGGIVGRTVETVFASVYVTAAVAALQGFLGGLMFWVLGLPSPAFWGVVMGLLAIVPFLGAFVIWVPAAIGLALAGHWGPALVLALWGTLVVGLIDNLVYPILVGKRLSLHPMLSFIAIVGGVLVFGAHGIVLGPLVVAVAQALLEIWRTRIDHDQRAA